MEFDSANFAERSEEMAYHRGSGIYCTMPCIGLSTQSPQSGSGTSGVQVSDHIDHQRMVMPASISTCQHNISAEHFGYILTVRIKTVPVLLQSILCSCNSDFTTPESHDIFQLARLQTWFDGFPRRCRFHPIICFPIYLSYIWQAFG